MTEAGKHRLFHLLGSFHKSVRAKLSVVFIYVDWVHQRIRYDIVEPPK